MNLDLMVVIDKQFLETPFSRRAADDVALAERVPCCALQAHPATGTADGEGEPWLQWGRASPEAMPIYRKPDTSRPAKGHKTYPYLLGGLRVERPNQFCCADIVFLPMLRGFRYLVAIMEWHTRKVMAWRI
ncbi:MAG: hypothetical protein O9292_11260 [Rhodobacteraceae bacterium]|jgi:putative transposase|nr:hypothetical protein [Paracoccaceae bacterium]